MALLGVPFTARRTLGVVGGGAGAFLAVGRAGRGGRWWGGCLGAVVPPGHNGFFCILDFFCIEVGDMYGVEREGGGGATVGWGGGRFSFQALNKFLSEGYGETLRVTVEMDKLGSGGDE